MRVTLPDGRTIEYNDVTDPLTPEEIEEAEHDTHVAALSELAVLQPARVDQAVEALEAGGHDVKAAEVLDSAGWGGWRNRTDRVLATLFPVD